MVVYKFGGASVKDAEGIRNLARIASAAGSDLVIVVSAFGKTTNALEEVLRLWFKGDPDYRVKLEGIFRYHSGISEELTGKGSETSLKFVESYSLLAEYLGRGRKESFDTEYDQVVSFGEIWSTIIVAGYLSSTGINTEWVDIRYLLLTDSNYRDAGILWNESEHRIKRKMQGRSGVVFVTQGFIGATAAGRTTTLGREGSDYTAAILGNMLDASKVVFWKDVPGILNADPNWKKYTVLLGEISYKEAVEMTFSGAKVIHPKTIKPLHNKSIPLHVKSFLSPEAKGTEIKGESAARPDTPVFVKKENQILISILPLDFSFVMGDNLGLIFHAFANHGIKINLVQASAVSIDVCADDDRDKIELLIRDLETEYKTIYNDKAELITVRHYNPESLKEVTAGTEVLLEQRTRRIVRFVLRKPS